MIIDWIINQFVALDSYTKLAVLMLFGVILLGLWTYNFFEKVVIVKDSPMKAQTMFYIKQRGGYNNRAALKIIENMVENDMKNRGLLQDYFVAAIMYDDPKQVKVQECRMIAGLCFPKGKLTDAMEAFLKEHKFSRAELPECTVDKGMAFSFNNLSLTLNRRRMLNERQRMLNAEGITGVGRFPMMEIYFPDKAVFAFPSLKKGEDFAKSLKGTAFVFPEEAKKKQ